MPVTVRGTDILFNDGSTQAAGLRFDAADAIGSVMILRYTANNNPRKPGDTVSGSYLFRVTSGGAGLYSGGAGASTISDVTGTPIFPSPASTNVINRTTAFTAAQFPSGSATWSPVSGTWRVLNSLGNAARDDYTGLTYLPSVLCIRIS